MPPNRYRRFLWLFDLRRTNKIAYRYIVYSIIVRLELIDKISTMTLIRHSIVTVAHTIHINSPQYVNTINNTEKKNFCQFYLWYTKVFHPQLRRALVFRQWPQQSNQFDWNPNRLLAIVPNPMEKKYKTVERLNFMPLD